MRLLFLHQNIPGQFVHQIRALCADASNEVWAIGEEAAARRCARSIPSLRLVAYKRPEAAATPHAYLADADAQVRRGQVVATAMRVLRSKGFVPDLIVAHPGWGESLFVKDVFPGVPLLQYFEFFFSARGGDVGFDPEQPSTFESECRLRIRNALYLSALESSDAGISPTAWQRSRFPTAYRDRISVIHDGIDTGLVRPDPQARFETQGESYVAGDPIVTFVARSLEPYRGFHVFMRALPEILALRPDSRVVIVGGDGVSYGRLHPSKRSWRSVLTEELGDRVDWRRVRFTGKLPYARYLELLQASAVHAYLTYPFVLSWSMLEAMSAGGIVVASATAPVQELIIDGVNGLLFDFFDKEALVRGIAKVLGNPAAFDSMRRHARDTIVERYDLSRVCLPKGLAELRRVARAAPVAPYALRPAETPPSNSSSARPSASIRASL